MQGDNPYRHFAEKGSKCYNRLFVGAYDRFIDEDDPVAFEYDDNARYIQRGGEEDAEGFIVIEDENGLLRLA